MDKGNITKLYTLLLNTKVAHFILITKAMIINTIAAPKIEKKMIAESY